MMLVPEFVKIPNVKIAFSDDCTLPNEAIVEYLAVLKNVDMRMRATIMGRRFTCVILPLNNPV